ncbi:hypothetical protein [Nocardia otitidiscaviarum]|uniref:hypothetical protein n=1 Tax=Nocardia otitidiscaviarum TaxID=1823 RepID=UPI00189345CD|nr:hypothetical protein [Nocardia otitidiscaviarum]MBF6183331.1 hypothetical protein [Nocardia otitidiscaviarum]
MFQSSSANNVAPAESMLPVQLYRLRRQGHRYQWPTAFVSDVVSGEAVANG